MRWYSILLLVVISFYLINTIWTFYGIFFPVSCVESGQQRCINPVSGDEYSVRFFVTTRKEMRAASDGDLLHESKVLMSDMNSNASLTITANLTVPRMVTRSNRSLMAYVFATPTKYLRNDELITKITSWDSVELTRFMIPRAETFLLITTNADNQTVQRNTTSSDTIADQPCMHLRRDVSIMIAADNYSFDSQAVPSDLLHLLRYSQISSSSYRRLLRFDKLAFRERELRPLRNETTAQLTISYKLVSIGRLHFAMQLEGSMQALTTLGFSEKDTDEVKGLFLDTNFALLITTFVISIVHLVFDLLAFKNDIQFWRERRSLTGLSLSTVLWRCVSTIIIFFYLLNEQTSLLVTVPCGFSLLIEIWKCSKATKLRVTWSGGRPHFEFGERNAGEQQTEEFDAQATRYLCYALIPLCMAGVVYSLLYVEFTGWYSFVITMLANGVYAFGFVFMCPQLFVNYKLKSVAHLPWRVFIYKAFNTFIDDCFAFIIQMPTAHRVACFRDDIVFVVYLFQRWIYPVDKSRMNEFGQSFDDETEKSTNNSLKQLSKEVETKKKK